MKSFVKWLIKKFASVEKIKDAIHKANAKLAEKQASERTMKVTEYCADATDTTSVYAKAFANDGKMDEGELVGVNAQCDAMVDKYLGGDRLDAFVDAMFS